MDRVPVSSRNLASVGYDAANSTLEVEFREGGLYQYFDVPAHEHGALMQASSHGEYFSALLETPTGTPSCEFMLQARPCKNSCWVTTVLPCDGAVSDDVERALSTI